MRNANAVISTEPEIPTIELTVALVNGVGEPSATTVGIPWNQVTNLHWTIATPGVTFRGTGVSLDGDAPLRVTGLTDTTLTMTFDNSLLKLQGPFNYSLLVQSTGGPIRVDPTVENDPPPPRTGDEGHHRHHSPNHRLHTVKGGAR
jgi:hypothetical protein